ncbi:unnamed protein product [Soboliphyme baturini]|uniref:CA domain-containing protein n=1 Tax=Soboliphyme baturini TaxID=241478 RepID=A0A183IA51_9BILA|nr:unnamed protein product [Soboliphyme baturini]
MVTDSNDQKPWFDRAVYVTKVFENVPIGHKVLQLSTRDMDIGHNGRVHYTLITPVDEFAVNDLGIIFTTSLLDREMIDRYNLLVQAIDSGWPPQSSVATVSVHILDVNDNPPR